MAWSAADIDSAEITDAAADYPLFLAGHVIRGASSGANFDARWNADGNFATAADNNATYPPRRAYDSQSHIDTRSNTAVTSGNPQWLIFDAGTGEVFADFDCVMIGGHNLGTNSATCNLYVANGANVSAGTQIATWSPSDDKRLVSLDLDDAANANPQRFTGARYVGIQITVLSGSFNPRIGEVWLGRRRQLSNNFRTGHNPDQAMSIITEYESQSGVVQAYIGARDRRMVSGNYVTNTSAKASTVIAIYSDSDDATKPVVYVPDPNSAATTAYVMRLNKGTLMGGSQDSSTIRNWSFNMREAAPFFDRE